MIPILEAAFVLALSAVAVLFLWGVVCGFFDTFINNYDRYR